MDQFWTSIGFNAILGVTILVLSIVLGTLTVLYNKLKGKYNSVKEEFRLLLLTVETLNGNTIKPSKEDYEKRRAMKIAQRERVSYEEIRESLSYSNTTVPAQPDRQYAEISEETNRSEAITSRGDKAKKYGTYLTLRPVSEQRRLTSETFQQDQTDAATSNLDATCGSSSAEGQEEENKGNDDVIAEGNNTYQKPSPTVPSPPNTYEKLDKK